MTRVIAVRLKQWRQVIAIAKAARASLSGTDVSAPGRFLVVITTCVALSAAHLASRNRTKTADRAIDVISARTVLMLATVLRALARMLVRRRELFRAACVVARKSALPAVTPRGEPLTLINVLAGDGNIRVVHCICVGFPFVFATAPSETWFLVSHFWAKFRSDFLWYRALREACDPLGADDRVTFLANCPRELQLASDQGLRATLVNHNCFIEEARFPLAVLGGGDRYDAVLNANASPWKRHDLTREIERLAYITYSRDDEGRMIWPEQDFAPLYRNTHFLDEVERMVIYGKSTCGLVLSACEGANFSTVEYLLSGLPVVSTHSLGGRDIWFDQENCCLVPADSKAVGDAVRAWIERDEAGSLDRVRIRQRCLELMAAHRQRYVATLQEALERSTLGGSASLLFRTMQTSDRMLHGIAFRRSDSPLAHPHCGGSAWYHVGQLPF